MKQLLINLTDNEYEQLEFLSKRLEIEIVELFKSFIPRIVVHSEKNVKTYTANSDKLEIRKDFDIGKLKELIEKLELKKVALMLAKELRHQILETGNYRMSLTGITERRLRRWANPARIDERTKIASPIAREICVVLFGFNPGRGEQ